MNIIDKQYQTLLKDILENGEERSDRTGTGTLGIFGAQLKIDVSERIPLLTSKKVSIKNIIHETLWMFSKGSTNIQELQENGVKIWDQWANEYGDLGPIYGAQARAYTAWKHTPSFNDEGVLESIYPSRFQIDQLQNIITSLKERPYSRRHVMTLWNPATIPDDSLSFAENIKKGNSALPVCHGALIQFYVEADGKLSLQVYIRSSDTFLGLPYNFINYTLLLYMVCKVTGYSPKNIIVALGDAHIYKNHVEAVKELLSRPVIYDSPVLTINRDVDNINDFKFEDFELHSYEAYPNIKAPISV